MWHALTCDCDMWHASRSGFADRYVPILSPRFCHKYPTSLRNPSKLTNSHWYSDKDIELSLSKYLLEMCQFTRIEITKIKTGRFFLAEIFLVVFVRAAPFHVNKLPGAIFTTIWRAAIRGGGASRHQGGPMRGPAWNPSIVTVILYPGGLRGALNWVWMEKVGWKNSLSAEQTFPVIRNLLIVNIYIYIYWFTAFLDVEKVWN